MEKRRGPSTDICGAPIMRERGAEADPIQGTWKVLPKSRSWTRRERAVPAAHFDQKEDKLVVDRVKGCRRCGGSAWIRGWKMWLCWPALTASRASVWLWSQIGGESSKLFLFRKVNRLLRAAQSSSLKGRLIAKPILPRHSWKMTVWCVN